MVPDLDSYLDSPLYGNFFKALFPLLTFSLAFLSGFCSRWQWLICLPLSVFQECILYSSFSLRVLSKAKQRQVPCVTLLGNTRIGQNRNIQILVNKVFAASSRTKKQCWECGPPSLKLPTCCQGVCGKANLKSHEAFLPRESHFLLIQHLLGCLKSLAILTGADLVFACFVHVSVEKRTLQFPTLPFWLDIQAIRIHNSICIIELNEIQKSDKGLWGQASDLSF